MPRASLLLNLILAASFAVALVVPTVTHDAPVGGWVGSQGQIDSLPPLAPNLPQWTPRMGRRFRGCSSRKSRDLGDLIVVGLRGDVQRVEFGLAWERNHNAEDADDVWVVGWCAAA